MNNRTLIGIALGIIFLIGASYIIYTGRPVMNITDPSPSVGTISSIPLVTTPTTTDRVASPSTPTSTALQPKPTPTPKPTPASSLAPTPESTPQPGTYTLAQVQTRNDPSNCWTVIDGNVYDLTSWVLRHPGGESPIKGLCGTDGTARFERKHGGSGSAKAALILLKIGALR